MEPVFLLSLPRSGSTLVQRVLASHPDITTTSEPWLLLPFFYALRRKGIKSEYDHNLMVQALEDFCEQLPNKTNDYLNEIREMALRLYKKAGGEATYFLDKTPRYHLILDELLLAFPTCKIIILWRNPLAIAASMMETWSKGNWNLHKLFHIDLFTGLGNLVKTYEVNEERIFSMRFEDFVSDPDAQCRKLLKYLELPYHDCLTDCFTDVNLHGRMGDPTGVKQYRKVSEGSLNKWRATMANPWRKLWCRRYLRWIGENRLAIMGYQMDALESELAAVPMTMDKLLLDLARVIYGQIYRRVRRICLGN